MNFTRTPLISIVTPSLNQFRFLRACVASVEAQPLDAVEQLVIDGGSSDGTAEYLSGHPGRVGFWRSAPDRGQGDALNIGFARACGDWIGWQNSDDFYFPGAFANFLDVIHRFPAARVIIGDVAFVDVDGRATGSVGVAPVHALRWLEGYWP
ncbi:MAG: glycosyltransferase, partial [Acidobacteria bacterium]|nr:glycosyltransferase [Acidobacteriota bacterium]